MHWAPVPETAIDEHRKTLSCEYDIRFARQPVIDPVPVAECPEHFPDDDFGTGVPATYPRHAAAPLHRCQHISHQSADRVNNIGARGPPYILVMTPLQHLCNNVSQLVGQKWWNCVAYLSVLVASVAFKKVVIREGL